MPMRMEGLPARQPDGGNRSLAGSAEPGGGISPRMQDRRLDVAGGGGAAQVPLHRLRFRALGGRGGSAPAERRAWNLGLPLSD